MTDDKGKNLDIDSDKTTNLSGELLKMLKRAEKMKEEAKDDELKHIDNWGRD